MKGSQKHLLELIESEGFEELINNKFSKFGLVFDLALDKWMPKGTAHPKEAQLVDFLKDINQDLSVEIREWWLASKKKSNTPNWDFVATCKINGKNGLLLFEAKAHQKELSSYGKKLRKDSSPDSIANHFRIKNAISESCTSLQFQFDQLNISADSCYQLSNRIAYSWWLAQKGIPVILVYVGFLNANDVSHISKPFNTEEDWNFSFGNHLKCVGADSIIDTKINCGNSYFLITSLAIETRI